jgi:hypothetical protein
LPHIGREADLLPDRKLMWWHQPSSLVRTR